MAVGLADSTMRLGRVGCDDLLGAAHQFHRVSQDPSLAGGSPLRAYASHVLSAKQVSGNRHGGDAAGHVGAVDRCEADAP